MEFLFILMPILSIIWYVCMNASVRTPGNSLNQKFVSLGTLQGKTLAEITAVCGQPSSVSITATGTLRQWIATGYHIALLFDKDDMCVGITHESHV